MITKIADLQEDLFEELSDADSMAMVGGTGSATGFLESTYNNATVTVAKLGDTQGDARDQLLKDTGNFLFGGK
ncbi:hypothetical protein LC653_16645 [Nostoc sp. CHAB 5784]|uniref:hypothetical protein n=1 Tax=Nostoc mirabile TaxID=2907820 RepID=UPI001E58DB87|nr:hypothetical protein [Nostoc mirabile]MCC5665505.1 hypothetical protein [Nostoc mirabile CHAB5784]